MIAHSIPIEDEKRQTCLPGLEKSSNPIRSECLFENMTPPPPPTSAKKNQPHPPPGCTRNKKNVKMVVFAHIYRCI